jgi:hypothetical protein
MGSGVLFVALGLSGIGSGGKETFATSRRLGCGRHHVPQTAPMPRCRHARAPSTSTNTPPPPAGVYGESLRHPGTRVRTRPSHPRTGCPESLRGNLLIVRSRRPRSTAARCDETSCDLFIRRGGFLDARLWVWAGSLSRARRRAGHDVGCVGQKRACESAVMYRADHDAVNGRACAAVMGSDWVPARVSSRGVIR